MRFTLRVWRQSDGTSEGSFEEYSAVGVSPDMSFLEMLDLVNEGLVTQGMPPIAFDHDCREGICGMCSLVINGLPHGPRERTTACQLHMREFADGETISIEPWRARAFPVIRDLVVDRRAFDRVIQAGGFVSVKTGSAPDANAVPVPQEQAEAAFDAAACIGCGACVAACPNASASLFVAAKAQQLSLLPQGQPERGPAAPCAWSRRWTGKASEDAPIITSAKPSAPRASRCASLPDLNRDYLKAALTSRDTAPLPSYVEEE